MSLITGDARGAGWTTVKSPSARSAAQAIRAAAILLTAPATSFCIPCMKRCVELGVNVYEEWLALSLAIDNGRIHGVIAMEMATGRLETFAAKVVVIATGGYGRLFARSSNALINTGLGHRHGL